MTIDGGNHTVTAPDNPSDDDNTIRSYPLKLTGSGTVILKNITLKGGAVSLSSQYTIGLWTNLDADGLVISEGAVNVIGGNTDVNAYPVSIGLLTQGDGTVNILNATGGTMKGTNNYGVWQHNGGTVNIHTATGGNWTHGDGVTISCGVRTSGNGIINVTHAIGGKRIDGPSTYGGSKGVDNSGGRVNVTTATAQDASTDHGSRGVSNQNNGIVNVATAVFGSGNIEYSGRAYIGVGTVNIGGVSIEDITIGTATGTKTVNYNAIDTLTLEANGGSCVLSAITVAKTGSTTVGTLPAVYKDGIAGKWYTDSAHTTLFSGTTVSGGGTLYAGWVSANLTGLALSGTPGNYTFAGGTYTYDGVTVANGVASITVTPTGAGTITVEGTEIASGAASGAIDLTAGDEKTITVVATETGKTAKTYTIKITRAAAAPATYAVSAMTNAVVANGVTATASYGASPYAAGASASVTITLTGTATAVGTHTIGLTQ